MMVLYWEHHRGICYLAKILGEMTISQGILSCENMKAYGAKQSVFKNICAARCEIKCEIS